MYSTSHFHTNMDANMDMIPATGIDWFAVRCTRIQQRKFIQDQRSELLAKSNWKIVGILYLLSDD